MRIRGIDNIKADVLNISYNLDSYSERNLLENTIYTQGYYPNWDRSGALSPNPDYKVSDFIIVKGLKTLTLKNVTTSVNPICFYDRNKSFINGVYNKTFIDIPENAAYARFGIPLVDESSIEIHGSSKIKDLYASVDNAKLEIEKLSNDTSALLNSNELYYDNSEFSQSSGGCMASVYLVMTDEGFIKPCKSIKVTLNKDSADNYIYLFGGSNTDSLTCLEIQQGLTAEFDPTKYSDYDTFSIAIYAKELRYYMSDNYPFYEYKASDPESIKESNTIKFSTVSGLKIFYDLSITIYSDDNINDRISKIESSVKDIYTKLPNVVKNRVITVAKDGSGDYTTINAALKYAYTLESKDNPITIIIYPGVYNEVCNINGKHFVSLIGVNRNDCIIKDTTGLYQNCPLRVEGDAYIANLSLISNNESGTELVKDNVVQQNLSYGLHIDDRHADNDDDYRITVYNCYIYSAQNPAVGIGLDKNQTVELINCELVREDTGDIQSATSTKSGVWGAKLNGGSLFYHALYKGSYTNENGYQKLVVKDCIIRNNSKNVAVGEDGGMTEQVELEFINNVGYASNGPVFVKGLSKATISKYSYGNNCNGMNYVE